MPSCISVGEAAGRLLTALLGFVDWVVAQKLSIAPSKSTVTLFTPDTHQSDLHPHITVCGAAIALEKRPKILGVTFDTHFTFSAHCKAVAEKARRKVAILKATAGSTWGATKEILATTFKGHVKSTINFAAPVWAPNASPSSVNLLQRVQNSALRVATGCHSSTPVQHLHQEMLELPVAEHLHLLGAQFLASASRLGHQSFTIAMADPGPRQMKETLRTKYSRVVEPFLVDGILPSDDHKQAINKIHSDTVTNYISELHPNPILGYVSPPVDKLERSLPLCAAPMQTAFKIES